MTEWLILLAFGVAWLAGWCSRWQFEKAREEPDEQPFERWAKDCAEQARNGLAFNKNMFPPEAQESFDRWGRDL